MKTLSEKVKLNNSKINNIYTPVLYDLKNKIDQEKVEQLLINNSSIKVLDEIESQVSELIKLRNPKFNKNEVNEATKKTLNIEDKKLYGVWVYYPWLNTLIHILRKKEFIEVRTNRNKYKITEEEGNLLSTKKIGIIGLSVGRAIAVTLATERTVGEIRLGDFDVLELSNLNRIQTSLTELGVSKVISTARQIAEIDPYIKIVCFKEGINKENIHDFCMNEGKLDLLIDECDSLDIKIFSRITAKKLKIPVLMDTNDRGMIDIERFDLEPNRPILHGLIEHLPIDKLGELSLDQKIPYILAIINENNISSRLKYSMTEINKTITSWPQLSSSVQLGAAVSVNVCRRILLNALNVSGRFYIDLDQLIKN